MCSLIHLLHVAGSCSGCSVVAALDPLGYHTLGGCFATGLPHGVDFPVSNDRLGDNACVWVCRSRQGVLRATAKGGNFASI